MTPEGEVLRAVLDFLQAEKITAFRMNTGGMSGEHKGKKWFVQFGVPGFADILALPTVTGQFKGFPCSWTAPWFIEVKAEKGKQSATQKSFERQVKDAGAEYFLIRSVDEMKAALRKHGVIA